MVRSLLYLLILVGVGLLVWTLLRRRPSSTAEHEYGASGALPAERAAPALAAPGDGSGERETFQKLHALSLGAPVTTEVAEPHAAVMAAVGATLAGDVAQLPHAPRRPLLLPQLMRAVNDGETSSRELATLIARDPALAGNLLRFANSPLYRVNTQPVESVDRAVTLLGFDGIRSLICTALVQPVFRVTSSEFANFPEITWEHTFRSSAAAEAHAAIIENSDPFAAQLLALVMGLAGIIVFRTVLEEYAARRPLRADASVIASLLDAHSARVARRVADDWELSGRVLAALEDQVPELGMNRPASLGRSLRFGRLVAALSMLRLHQLIDDERVKAVMAEQGTTGPHFERIWARLSQLKG